MLDRVLLAIITRALPSADREWMSGDLEEEFLRVSGHHGRWTARRWLVGEFLRNLGRRASIPKVKFMNWIDLKLGVRMLVKYPGLTMVGGLAMAFAIWAGVVAFAMLAPMLYPSLPLTEGHRVVQLEVHDAEKNGDESRILYDYTVWQGSLRSVTDLGAWRNSGRNLVLPGVETKPVRAAEMSASGFQVGEGEPLMGRVLTDADADPAAPLVAVIGFGLWQSRFGSDPAVVGKSVQLGNEHAVVVGVMREGFEFPVSHDLWLPFRPIRTQPAPRSGPPISVFGRIAPGETLETAQAELATLGQRVAADHPATHQHLEPKVSPYAGLLGMGGDESVIMSAIYIFVLMLITLVCGNVGLLIFARAASREGDLIVRTALGASRGRIVWQLFAEALVLGVLAASVGLVAAHFTLKNWGVPFLEANIGRLPFWWDVSLSPLAVINALALAIFGAAVAGVIPAFKLTRGMSDKLKQSSAGSGGLQFGGVWTVIIIAQITATTMFPGALYWERYQLSRVADFDYGFAADQYLTAKIDRDASTSRETIGQRLEELRRRVAAEPGVSAVTFVESLPALYHPSVQLEFPDNANIPSPAYARLAAVEPGYFDVLQSPVIAGRTFTAADVQAGSRVAIVDQGFVDRVLKGRNPIGLQVRFAPDEDAKNAAPEPWVEIVGLAKDLGVQAAVQPTRVSGFYLPAPPDRLKELYLMAHVPSGDPASLSQRLVEITTAVDPTLQLSAVQRADQVNSDLVWIIGLWLQVTSVVSAVAVVLSLAGIYAVLSFTVSRRTREIGVRVALGGPRDRVILAILRKPLVRVVIGVFVGAGFVLAAGAALRTTSFPGSELPITVRHIAVLAGYMVFMVGVCSLACIVPARRALRVEPTVALRTE
jgi:putative ABC transport system permease protein